MFLSVWRKPLMQRKRVCLAEFVDDEQVMHDLALPRVIIRCTKPDEPRAMMRCGHLSDYFEEDNRQALCSKCLFSTASARIVAERRVFVLTRPDCVRLVRVEDVTPKGKA
jgi:hypothetical protein